MKKIIIIVSIVLVLAIGATAAMFIFKAPPATPIQKVENAIEKSIETLSTANTDTISKNLEFASSGSVEISADLGQLMKYSGADMDLDAMLKLYMDAENSKFAEELNLSINNQTIIDALIALNENNFAIKSDTILGKDAYGITFADFFDKFDSSIFGPNGAYSLGVTSEELKENLSAAFTAAFKTAFDSAKVTAETEALADKFAKDFKEVLYTSLYTNATFAEADGALTVAGSEIQTTDISIILNEEQATTVLLDLLKFIRDSEDFKTLFITCAEITGVYSTGDTIGFGSAAFYLDVHSTDPEEVYNDFIEIINESIEELSPAEEESTGEVESSEEETEDTQDEFTLTITFHISKDNGELIGVSLGTIGEDSIDEVEVKFGPSFANIDQIILTSKSDDLTDSIEADSFTVEYIVNEDSESSYKASINVSSVEYYKWNDEVEEDKEAVNVTLEWDKQEYDYSLEIEYTSDGETEKVTLGGIYQAGEDCEILTLTTVGAQGIKLDIGEVKLVTRYSDTVPEIPEFTEVLDMTEEDVEELVETFEQFAAMLEMFLG